MPNIRPGMSGAGIPPQQMQSAAPKGPASPKPVQAAQETNSSDRAQFQGKTTGAERSQRLTSETTRAQIHQLIKTAVIQVPEQRPALQLLNRPAMSSALADMLSAHHPAETAQSQQSQTAAQQGAANAHAQMAGGSLAAASHQNIRASTEDSSDRNTTQSGKRARSEEQEGEFSSLTDSEGGMDQGDSSHDQRSDSQKKKQLLNAQKAKTAPDFEKGPQHKKPLHQAKTLSRTLQPPTLKKTGSPPAKSSLNKPNKPASPKDEWTF